MATILVGIGQCGINVAGRLLQLHGSQLDEKQISVFLVDTCVNTLSAHKVIFGEDRQGAQEVRLQDPIVKGLGTSGMRDKALSAYETNKEVLETLLDVADCILLVAGLGGGIGSSVMTRLAQDAARKGLKVVAYGVWAARWEHPRRYENCRWVAEQLQEYPVELNVIDSELLVEEYCKIRDLKERTVLDFRKSIWDDAIVKYIMKDVSSEVIWTKDKHSR